jgi:hypothetical protein
VQPEFVVGDDRRGEVEAAIEVGVEAEVFALLLLPLQQVVLGRRPVVGKFGAKIRMSRR